MDEQVRSGSKHRPSGDESSASKRPKSSILDSIVLLNYEDHFVDQLQSLGVVLGVKEKAAAVLATQASHSNKYIQITDMWMKRTPNPMATWGNFCSCLSKCNNFTGVRTLIEKEQLGRYEVTQDEANHTLTDEEFAQLKQFKVKEGSVVWMMLGVTGAGKSCLGNFLLVQDSAFPESSDDMISETERAALKCSSLAFDTENLCVIDTPGLGDTGNIGSFESGSEDIAYDYSKLATELTKVMMMTDQGINAFLIVVPAGQKDYHGFIAFLNFFDIIGAYWNHSILLVTHGKQRGKTEKEQYAKFYAALAHPKGPAPLKNVLGKVSDRLVIVESKDWRDRPEYHRSVVGKIMKYSKEITERHGPFKDDLQSIGQEAYEKAKLELRNEFEDMNSPEAQAAVFKSTFKHVRDVIYRLVRIRMPDGKDVDKIKEMAKVKEEELNEVRKQNVTLRKEYLEEELRRKEAEEKQRQEEDKRKQAEEQQRQEEESRKQAQKKLEEYLKKPTFKDRTVTARVYKSNFHSWEWVHSAEAIDEGTGTTAKAQNYKSKEGALEHANRNLKAVLIEKGIIRKDD